MPDLPHPGAAVRPRRTITGMSAILLPFTDGGDVDWAGFAAHVERTAAAGLTPGVVVLAVDGREVNDIVTAARQLRGRDDQAKIKLDVLQVRRSGLFLRRRTGRLTLQLR